jgi:hypothetical protein
MKTSFLFLLLIGVWKLSSAQTGATNSGTLYISSSSDIFYAAGDFTNGLSAALTNNGSLYVKGNLTNDQSSMAAGTGTLYLNGTSTQSISGSQSFNTYNLNTNNALGISLSRDLSVSGTHTFVNGLITTGANYLVYQNNANYTGATNAAHVNGWVRKSGLIGSSFTFPTGNTTYLREIAISGLTSAATFDAKYNGSTTNTNNLSSPIVQINPYEYWTLIQSTGSANAQVTLNWDRSKVYFPGYTLADLRASFYNGNWTNAGGSYAGTIAAGSITSTSIPAANFGSMSIGSVSLTILPLNFISTKVALNNNQASIEWKTTNESNVAGYEIQKSITGTSFTTIGHVQARNATSLQTYSFEDPSAISATTYYRIKSVDLDGKTQYSKVVTVMPPAISETMAVINNPVKNAIRISAGHTSNTYEYLLLTAEGKLAQNGMIQYAGSGTISIPLNTSILPGTYILTIKNKQVQFTRKIVVQ